MRGYKGSTGSKSYLDFSIYKNISVQLMEPVEPFQLFQLVSMQQISPEELKDKLSANKTIFLVDVREPYEHEAFNIGGALIPLPEIISRYSEIPEDKMVIVYCKMGIHSRIAIQRLQEKFGFTNLINLKGGMESWKKVFGSEF